jgi:hypothetical protein
VRRITWLVLWLLVCGGSAAAQTLVPGDPILLERSTDACYSCHAETRRDSHPVGIAYDSVRMTSSAGLRRSSTQSPFGSTIARDLLVDGRVECVSCHLVHADETMTLYRLRIPEGSTRPGYSGLCAGCHDMNGR